ncbi:MAG: hemerythrin family protein [Spirochaetia bacterium]|nr:hemerythrin family protein [Spirochaetia bacterium]
MAFYDWNPGIETGIALIDSQHRRLVDLINDLHEAMIARKGKEITARVLDELADYTVYHFGVEERAFAKHGYERAAEQKASHDHFVARLKDMRAKYERGSLMVNVEALDFLLGWIKKHILNEDMLYVPFFEDKSFD